MAKVLCSLMLDEDVLREVDAAAHRQGLNRSYLINQILADYASVLTPERRVENIFRSVEQLLAPTPDLVPFFAPNAMTMSLKSALAYRYRPTVKYEVELFRPGQGEMGELTVLFRTQSAELIDALTDFFRLWTRIEDRDLAPLLSTAPRYALYEGKFVRSICAPARPVSAEDIAQALSGYIRLFDRLMKEYLGGRLSAADAEREYRAYLSECETLI